MIFGIFLVPITPWRRIAFGLSLRQKLELKLVSELQVLVPTQCTKPGAGLQGTRCFFRLRVVHWSHCFTNRQAALVFIQCLAWPYLLLTKVGAGFKTSGGRRTKRWFAVNGMIWFNGGTSMVKKCSHLYNAQYFNIFFIFTKIQDSHFFGQKKVNSNHTNKTSNVTWSRLAALDRPFAVACWEPAAVVGCEKGGLTSTLW